MHPNNSSRSDSHSPDTEVEVLQPSLSFSNQTPYNITMQSVTGRRTFVFWTLVVLLFILALGNFIITVSIISVLRLGYGLRDTFQLITAEQAIKFFGNTNLGHIYKRDGLLQGFVGEPMVVSADQASVVFNLQWAGRPQNKLQIDVNGSLIFRDINSWRIMHQDSHGTNDMIFDLSSLQLPAVRGAHSLHTKLVQANRLVSPIGQNMKIEAGHALHIRGSEGILIDGKQIVLSTIQEHIDIKSVNGSLVLDGSKGAYVDVRRMPILGQQARQFYPLGQYKICVCMPQGKLFRVPVQAGSTHVYCHHIKMTQYNNPCG